MNEIGLQKHAEWSEGWILAHVMDGKKILSPTNYLDVLFAYVEAPLQVKFLEGKHSSLSILKGSDDGIL
jgi:hypothetical protein